MNPDYVLLLSAGLGTRMGEIGKQLPKPLWPIFETSLLELQIKYAQNFHPKIIYINAHHQSEMIKVHIRKLGLQNIVVLEEPELLGVGGAVQSVKKIHQNGLLLIFNADLFYLLSEEDMNYFLSLSCKNNVILLSVEVGPSMDYNKLLIDQSSYLKNILKKSELPQTYSGVSVVKLDNLTHVNGFSDFFETVANYKERNILIYSPSQACEYWDFGTLERYCDSILQICKKWDVDGASKMRKLLIENNAVLLPKISKTSYYSNSKNTFNFSGKLVNAPDNCFILKVQNEIDYSPHHLYYNDTFDKFSGKN